MFVLNQDSYVSSDLYEKGSVEGSGLGQGYMEKGGIGGGGDGLVLGNGNVTKLVMLLYAAVVVLLVPLFLS